MYRLKDKINSLSNNLGQIVASRQHRGHHIDLDMCAVCHHKAYFKSVKREKSERDLCINKR